jgi:hypothetical protein
MAVSPTTTRQQDVLGRLAHLRGELEALIAAIRDGGLTLADVFADSHSLSVEHARGFVYLVKLAESVPGVGKVKARRVLEEHDLGERTRVCEVAPDTRDALTKALA